MHMLTHIHIHAYIYNAPVKIHTQGTHKRHTHTHKRHTHTQKAHTHTHTHTPHTHNTHTHTHSGCSMSHAAANCNAMKTSCLFHMLSRHNTLPCTSTISHANIHTHGMHFLLEFTYVPHHIRPPPPPPPPPPRPVPFAMRAHKHISEQQCLA